MKAVSLDDELELMRRLGEALIALWDNVPGDLQAAILSEVSSAFDLSHRASLEEELKQSIMKMSHRDSGTI